MRPVKVLALLLLISGVSHASSNTYDKVDLPRPHQHIAIPDFLTFAAAGSPVRLGPHQNRAEIESLLRDTHLDDQLKAFGSWRDWEKGRRGRSH